MEKFKTRRNVVLGTEFAELLSKGEKMCRHIIMT
jgi:hypothetical protein